MLSLEGESQSWELAYSFHSSENDTRPSYVNTSSGKTVAHREMGLSALPCPAPLLGSSLDPLPRMAAGICSSPQSPSGLAGGGTGSPEGTPQRAAVA